MTSKTDNLVDKFMIDNISLYSIKYSEETWNHYKNILTPIKDKLFYPDKPECNFVELVVSEQWDKAFYIADTRNKEAFKIDLFQNFIKYIKNSPEYIQYNRDIQLNKLL
jgi:hypothetical protein